MYSRMRIVPLHTLVWLFAVAMMVVSCSEKKIDQKEVVGKTAKLYYEYLLQGKYDAYVDGFHRPDSIPRNYRSQLIDNAKMFMAQQKEEHNGIVGVEVGNVTIDTALHAANVFLVLSYGDSIKEQVLVPMIQKNDIWMMR